MKDTIYDVAVIGAGPAGSAAAAGLAQRGWKVLLLEQDTLPRHKVCGEFLSPEAQSTLQQFDLYAPVAALAPVALHRAEITAQGGQCVKVALPGAAWGVSRFALDAALANAAQKQGATLWTGVSVSEYAAEEGKYRLRPRTRGTAPEARGSASVTARAVILACGRHSRLTTPESERAATGQDRLRRRRRYVGIKCHFEHIDLPDQVELFFFRGGYGGINPVENGRANFCMLVTYEAFQGAGKEPSAMLDAARERHPALDERLGGARLLPSTLKTVAAVDTSRAAIPWSGAPCIGDAAAMITPLCGDGMAMALRSAALCVPLADAYLHQTISLAEWANMYRSVWHTEFSWRIRIGRLLQGAMTQPSLAGHIVNLGRWTPPLVSLAVHATRGSTSPRLP